MCFSESVLVQAYILIWFLSNKEESVGAESSHEEESVGAESSHEEESVGAESSHEEESVGAESSSIGEFKQSLNHSNKKN